MEARAEITIERPAYIGPLEQSLLLATEIGVKSFLGRNPDYHPYLGDVSYFLRTSQALTSIGGHVNADQNVQHILMTDSDGVFIDPLGRINQALVQQVNALSLHLSQMMVVTNRSAANRRIFRTNKIEEVCNSLGLDCNKNFYAGMDQQTGVFRDPKRFAELATFLGDKISKGVEIGKKTIIHSIMDLNPVLGGPLTALCGGNFHLMSSLLQQIEGGGNGSSPSGMAPQVNHYFVLQAN